MMKIILAFFIGLFFGACSFKSEPNAWQYKSINAFSAYTKNFLSANDALAKVDLNRAISHAKKSAKLLELSRIYLGECALNISVGIKDSCPKYKEIADLSEDEKLFAYNAFIHSRLLETDVEHLEKHYQDFARYKIKNENEKAIKNLFEMDKITSKLLSASLVRDALSYDDVEKLIDAASFYGYKKSVIFWLEVQKSKTNDTRKIQKIQRKIKVLG